MYFVQQRGNLSVCAASLCFLTACRQSGHGLTVTDSHKAERDRQAESGMTAPANRLRLVEEADARSET